MQCSFYFSERPYTQWQAVDAESVKTYFAPWIHSDKGLPGIYATTI